MPKNKEPSPLGLVDFSAMDPEDLAEVCEDSLKLARKNKDKVDALQSDNLALQAEYSSINGTEITASIVGGGLTGAVMGDRQRRVDTGEIDEDSIKLGGMLDYDLAMGVGAAVGSYVAKKSGVRKERMAPGSGQDALKMARMLKGFAYGAASGAAYRLGYSATVTPPEEEEADDEETDEDDQAAV